MAQIIRDKRTKEIAMVWDPPVMPDNPTRGQRVYIERHAVPVIPDTHEAVDTHLSHDEFMEQVRNDAASRRASHGATPSGDTPHDVSQMFYRDDGTIEGHP